MCSIILWQEADGIPRGGKAEGQTKKSGGTVEYDRPTPLQIDAETILNVASYIAAIQKYPASDFFRGGIFLRAWEILQVKAVRK